MPHRPTLNPPAPSVRCSVKAGLVLFLGLSCWLGSLLTAPVVVAQIATPVPAETPASTPVASESPSVGETESVELQNLRQQYRTQLGIYRTDERDFTLARDQFNQLQTLAALETVVRATRKVMLSRLDVLQTHLQIVRYILDQTAGIDVAEKNQLLAELDGSLSELRAHQEKVDKAVDRPGVNQVSYEFLTVGGRASTASYKGLSYIAYGRLQTVYDKTLAIRDEISQYIETQEANGLRLGERRRALAQTNLSLDDTRGKLAAVRQSFQPSRGRESQFTATNYGVTLQSLTAVYADLNRNLTLLREVVKP